METDGAPLKIATLTTEDYFGEVALLENRPRSATITAVGGPLFTLKLDRAAFHALLGPLKDIMDRAKVLYPNHPDYEKSGTQGPRKELKASQKDLALSAPAGDAPVPVYESYLVEMDFFKLKVLGVLGKGSFGFVQLVQHKETGHCYALKAVSKMQIVETGQQAHILNEKKTMSMVKHPFLIRLWSTYQDRDTLYFLLESCLGGELFTILRKKTFFNEATACFYAANIIIMWEYLHSKQIVHRDLKPENLLLTETGYMKLTDFGFAKQLENGRTWTLCGTPDYLAPEIVAGKGHSFGVDWWTLGVLLFEMVASYPPFYDQDQMKIYQKICHGKIKYPLHFSKDLVSLLKKLLHRSPAKRLGVVMGGSDSVKQHPFFKDIDFKKLENFELSAPIIPNIKSEHDVSNFDAATRGNAGFKVLLVLY